MLVEENIYQKVYRKGIVLKFDKAIDGLLREQIKQVVVGNQFDKNVQNVGVDNG